jgi:hypothetical protein
MKRSLRYVKRSLQSSILIMAPLLQSRACPNRRLSGQTVSIHMNFQDANKIGRSRNLREGDLFTETPLCNGSYLTGAFDV